MADEPEPPEQIEGVYNDGGAPIGTDIVEIGAEEYIAETVSDDEGTTELVTEDENGVPNRQVFIRNIKSGSITLQLESKAQSLPETLTPFTYYDENLLVTQVGRTRGAKEIWKCTISFKKLIHEPVVAV